MQDNVESSHRLSPPNECDSEYKSIGILLSKMDIGSPITDNITTDYFDLNAIWKIIYALS